MKCISANWRALAACLLISVSMAQPARAVNSLNVAIVGEADTFDPMISTKDVISIVTQHFVETLYTFDDAWSVAPLLAKSLPEISDDGLTYDITLRQGVKFHDGTTMDSADVVDSLKRWLTMASRGKAVASKVSDVTATARNRIRITLNEQYSPLVSLLAFSNSAAAIYPQEILGETLSAVIGTGPYKVVKHVPDQYLQLARYEDYRSHEHPATGAAGPRHQIPDEIRFIPVPDPNTRVEGLLSGQFDFADSLPSESLTRIKRSETATPMLLEPFGWPMFAINHKQGLLTSLPIRRALQAALPMDDMLYAAFGDDQFFTVDGPMYPEGWSWRSSEGVDKYNRNSQQEAAKILKGASYDGTPLRILTSRQYEFHFKMAVVAQMALEASGFTVQLDVVDWATLGQRRNDPALWDVYITHSPFLPEPSLTSLYSATSRLGWNHPEKNKVLKQFTTETGAASREALFGELQKLVFDDVGFIKIGNFNALMGHRNGLKGVPPSPWPYFWNATTDR